MSSVSVPAGEPCSLEPRRRIQTRRPALAAGKRLSLALAQVWQWWSSGCLSSPWLVPWCLSALSPDAEPGLPVHPHQPPRHAGPAPDPAGAPDAADGGPRTSAKVWNAPEQGRAGRAAMPSTSRQNWLWIHPGDLLGVLCLGDLCWCVPAGPSEQAN